MKRSAFLLGRCTHAPRTHAYSSAYSRSPQLRAHTHTTHEHVFSVLFSCSIHGTGRKSPLLLVVSQDQALRVSADVRGPCVALLCAEGRGALGSPSQQSHTIARTPTRHTFTHTLTRHVHTHPALSLHTTGCEPPLLLLVSQDQALRVPADVRSRYMALFWGRGES